MTTWTANEFADLCDRFATQLRAAEARGSLHPGRKLALHEWYVQQKSFVGREAAAPREVPSLPKVVRKGGLVSRLVRPMARCTAMELSPVEWPRLSGDER